MKSTKKNQIKLLMWLRQFEPVIGGIPEQYGKIARVLIDLGAEIMVLTFNDQGSYPEREYRDGIFIRRSTFHQRIPIPGVRGIFSVLWLFWHSIQMRKKYQVALLQEGIPGTCSLQTFVITPLLKMMGKKILVKNSTRLKAEPTDRFTNLSRLFFFAQRWLIDFFLPVSSEQFSDFIDVGIKKHKIFIIPNGVDSEVFHPISKEQEQMTRSDIGFDQERVALFIGRIDAEKGIGDLLEAWKTVCRKDNKALLVFLGDGPDLSKFEVKCRSLGIQERVRFVGEIMDVAKWMHAADLVVLPSYVEAMSNVVLQAMSAGKALVVTEPSVPSALAKDGWNMRIVPLQCPAKLASTFLNLFDIP